MMDLLLATSGGEAQAASGGYVDDVFSAYVRTGTGADVTVNTNIDMTKGYMLWTKGRSGAADHAIYDSARGVTFDLASNLTSAQTTQSTGLKSVSGTGHTIGSLAKMNTNAATYVDWVFRRAPKFFDVVTYTGDGASNRTLSHQLNADVGMITVKATSATGDWWVFHRSATGDLVLNTTAAQTVSKANIPSATTSTFTVNGSANTNGVTYVAYLWAHDPSAEGIVQCGSFTDSSPSVAVDIGWEPQFIITKSVTSDNWWVKDASRGMPTPKLDGPLLYANAAATEVSSGPAWPTATGFEHFGGTAGRTYIYLAIRRPNKPPTSGTQVYNAIARTGTGAAATVTGVGFAPDLAASFRRSGGVSHSWNDRLRGAGLELFTNATSNENIDSAQLSGFDVMDGVKAGTGSGWNTTSEPYINHFLKRAPGFFDVVCWNQVSGGSATVNHSLGVIPELIITKQRDGTRAWDTYHEDWPNHYLRLNQTSAPLSGTLFDNITSTSFRAFLTNSSNNVAYIFATKAGISKVGSYTGNGSSQTINCGFSTGARFILVKRTDSTGDWYVWDSVRGIIAANDPHLSLNTTAAEVTTDDSVDPDASGFIVNQNTATNINVSGGQYIFLAIA